MASVWRGRSPASIQAPKSILLTWVKVLLSAPCKVGLPTQIPMIMGGPMVRTAVKVAEGGGGAAMESDESLGPAEMEPITGRVKWFDATRGFGFLISYDVDGDVLLH